MRGRARRSSEWKEFWNCWERAWRHWERRRRRRHRSDRKKSVVGFEKDLKAMQKLVEDPKTDLFARIPHGTGQNIFREALLVADHNAYHLGQLVLLRRLLGAWTE